MLCIVAKHCATAEVYEQVNRKFCRGTWFCNFVPPTLPTIFYTAHLLNCLCHLTVANKLKPCCKRANSQSLHINLPASQLFCIVCIIIWWLLVIFLLLTSSCVVAGAGEDADWSSRCQSSAGHSVAWSRHHARALCYCHWWFRRCTYSTWWSKVGWLPYHNAVASVKLYMLLLYFVSDRYAGSYGGDNDSLIAWRCD